MASSADPIAQMIAIQIDLRENLSPSTASGHDW
jgi:hypothetical protein